MNIHRLVNSLGNELLEERSTSNPPKSKGIRPILMKRTNVPEGSQIYKKHGDTLKLECQVDGMPPPTIVWYKVGFFLFPSIYCQTSLNHFVNLLRHRYIFCTKPKHIFGKSFMKYIWIDKCCDLANKPDEFKVIK